MKSFDCESSSEGDEPTIHAISRGAVEPPQWLRVNSVPGWGWQGAVSIFYYLLKIYSNFVILFQIIYVLYVIYENHYTN